MVTAKAFPTVVLLGSIMTVSCGLPSMMAAPRRHKLFRAAESGDVKQVERLLDHGLNVDTSGFYSDRALRRAAAYGQCEVVKVLLDRGARTDDNIAELALRDAIARDHTCTVALLLDYGASANANYYLGGTPLMSAAQSGNVEAVGLLLRAGADPNLMGHYEGWVALEPCSATALVLAAKHGHAGVVKLLLAGGAEMEHRDEFNCSARDAAEQGGHHDVVTALEQARK